MNRQSGQSGSGQSAKLVLIGKGCNSNCISCPAKGKRFESDKNKLLKKIQNRKIGEEQIVFAGREPTIHSDFLSFVNASKNAGYKIIQVVTNARMFSIPEFTEKALLAGMNEVLVKVFSHDSELHDELTRTPGSWNQTLQGIKNLRKISNQLGGFFEPIICAGVYVCDSNTEDLQNTYDFLDSLKVDEVFFIKTKEAALPELKEKNARIFTLGFDSPKSYESYVEQNSTLFLKNSEIFKSAVKK